MSANSKNNNSVPKVAQDDPGYKMIMLGNEAIARGILEGNAICDETRWS